MVIWVEHVHLVLVIASDVVQPLLDGWHVVAARALGLVCWPVEVVDLSY